MPASKTDSQQSIVIQLGGNGAITIQSSTANGKSNGASKVNSRSSLDELKQEALRLGCKGANLPKRKADLLQWIEQRNQPTQVATIQISDGTVATSTSSSKRTKKSVAGATTKKAPARKGATTAKVKPPTKKITTSSVGTTKAASKSVKQGATPGTKATSTTTGKGTTSSCAAATQAGKATTKRNDSDRSPAKNQSPAISTSTPNGKRSNDTLLVQWLNSGSKKTKTDPENDRESDVIPKKSPATVLFPATNASASSTASKIKSDKKQDGTKPKHSASSSVKLKASKGKTDARAAPQPTPVPVLSSKSATPSSSRDVASNAVLPLPRISNKLTLAELQQEAIARGLDKKSTPKLKSELLHFLLDGSIHLSKTKAYQDVLQLKAQIESERAGLYEKSLALKLVEDRKREEQRVAKQLKLDEEQRQQEEERKAERKREITKQEAFHVHSFPLVHPHKFAKTCSLFSLGKSRIATANCDVCQQFGYLSASKPVWTCEKCDFDICQVCFTNENRTNEEKQRAWELKRQKQREEYLRWEELRRAQELEEEIRWDATKQFSKSITTPDANHKRTEGSKMKGFTVYCSSGYDNDGWHSYEGEPTKYFDTTWKTKKEANDRARYLFFWKNSYGVGPDEVEGNEGVVEEHKSAEGMVSFTVRPADSERWTVAVCPDQAYKYLDHASTSRHNHDRE
eukprot:Nitzschia sp. Nitz4//scaffold184_size43902//16498//18555//NITZ4_007281-RA/size43902-processed-gene-0.4-mRNA-1//1//CDS//3329539648//859//frame0